MDPVRNSLALRMPEAANGSAGSPEPSGTAFAERLVATVEEANRALKTAESSSEQLATGDGDIVETMVALSKADLSLKLVVTLRNRALEAYQDIMRLQL